MKQINEQDCREYELIDPFAIQKFNHRIFTTNWRKNPSRRNQFKIECFILVLLTVIVSSYAVAEANPENDQSFVLPSKKLTEQLSIKKYFPGEDDDWAESWTRKLIEKLNDNNLETQVNQEDGKGSEIPFPQYLYDPRFLSTPKQMSSNSYPEPNDDRYDINDGPVSNEDILDNNMDKKNTWKRVPSYNSWRKGKRAPSYNSWRKGKRVPSYNSWRKGKRVPSYNSWRKGKRFIIHFGGIKRDAYNAWRKGKRGPSYNSWRKGKRGPSYNSWRKGKRATLVDKDTYFSRSFNDPLTYSSNLFAAQKRTSEEENDERLQDAEEFYPLVNSDHIIEPVEQHRKKREIKADSDPTADNDFIVEKDGIHNDARETDETYEMHPRGKILEDSTKEHPSNRSNYNSSLRTNERKRVKLYKLAENYPRYPLSKEVLRNSQYPLQHNTS